jgi:hypothetical protein
MEAGLREEKLNQIDQKAQRKKAGVECIINIIERDEERLRVGLWRWRYGRERSAFILI